MGTLDLVDVAIELEEGVNLPFYATPGSAGMDIRANEEMIISPGSTVLVSTGFKVAVPEGYEIQIRPRSGLSLKTTLSIANSPGTIDSDYRGEIKIIIKNNSPVIYGKKPVVLSLEEFDNKRNVNKAIVIKKGDRIAQLVLQKVPTIVWKVVNDIGSIGEDRDSGFGGTGIK